MIQNQYNTINNRESKLDILTLCDPTETPLYSTLPKEVKVRSDVFEYYADRLKKPSRQTIADGKDVETFDNKAENRVRIQQRVQIMNNTWQVSRGQEKDADVAGVKDEVSRAKMISSLELKRSIESVLGSDQEAAWIDENQGSHIRGLGKFADSTNTNIPESVRALETSAGSTDTLTETGFRTIIQSLFEVGGNASGDYKLFAAPSLQNRITGFSRTSDEQGNILMAQRLAGATEITSAVRIYNSDWGRITIIPDLFLGLDENGDITDASRKRGFLFETKNAALAFNEDLWAEEYEDKGGGRRGAVWAKFTLIQKMPRAMASFN